MSSNITYSWTGSRTGSDSGSLGYSIVISRVASFALILVKSVWDKLLSMFYNLSKVELSIIDLLDELNSNELKRLTGFLFLDPLIFFCNYACLFLNYSYLFLISLNSFSPSTIDVDV
jgi:hypothetical protein